MRKVDLAYVAGIIDGEGSILIGKTQKINGYYLYLAVTVSNTNEWLCQYLKFNFGGSVCLGAEATSRHKAWWKWEIVCYQARNFLELVLPYLKLKKPQAELAIKFQSDRRRGHRKTEEQAAIQEAQRIIMRGMNKTGSKV